MGFEVRGSPWKDWRRKRMRACARTERALRESRKDLDWAQAVARTGSWRLDVNRNKLTWSAETFRIFGIPPKTRLTYESFLAAVHPDDRERVDRTWKAALAGIPYDIEHRIVVDAKTKWVRERAELEFGAAGKLLGGFGTVQDITDKKQAEEELARQQFLTHLIADRAADAIFLTDEKGRITYANPEAERSFGFEHREMMGRDLHELAHRHFEGDARFPPDDCPLSKFQEKGIAVHNHEDVFYRKDGSRVEVSCSYAPLDQDDRRSGGVFVVRDISAQKAAQAALRASEERFCAIVGTAVDAIIVIDEAGRIQSMNPAGERIFGYASGEVTGKNVSTLMPEPHRSAHDSYIAAYCKTGDAKIIGINREIEGCRKDGSLFAADLAVGEWRLGGKRYFSGTLRDISGRKQADEALRASEERFRGVYEHAATGIAIMDMDGRFLSCNPAYSSMLGYTEEELRQLTFADIVSLEDRDRYSLEIRRLAAQEIPSFEILNQCMGKDGTILWAHKHVSLLTDGAGSAAGIIVLVTNMTERKRHEEHVNMLMREVNHRSKNMLAVVQAIARQTAATKPDDFIERFGERIQALAASQDLLVRNEWKGVDLSELIRSQLAHFNNLIGTRVELRGTPVLISPPGAQSIGMIVHELATNAGKYGALSNDSGRVDVDWVIEHSAQGGQIFAMSWCEQGGPPVMVPARQGFGSTVISRMAVEGLDAQVKLEFLVAGLSWRLECPAAEVIDGIGSASSPALAVPLRP